jgi:hypothetical protein
MGNKSSNNQPRIIEELNINQTRINNQENARAKFIQNKRTLLGKYSPEPSAPPMPIAEAILMDIPIASAYLPDVKMPSAPPMPTDLRNQSSLGDNIKMGFILDKYPEDNCYELGLREGVDRTYISLVRSFLESGELDTIEILTRELDYVNDRISNSKHNKRRLQIREMIEERIRIVLK